MKIVVILPTYNEAENIEKVVRNIFSLSIQDIYVLVVDDNSPDNTALIVQGLQKEFTRLEIMKRAKKDGLGRAYIAGFTWALDNGAEYILEMDADLSHDSQYISVFLMTIKECDLVIGSRYILGGGVKNWNMARRIISRFGNAYAKIILGMPIHDLTSGFKCYRRKILESIDLDSLSSIGYNFQIETTYKAYRKGFHIKEVPIIFTERTSGKSKFNFKIILESFWKVLLLRIKG